ncbi:MAG: recombinase family protein [Anaerolineae bacterium]
MAKWRITKIAKALNGEHIAPPRSHGRGWAPTAVREMLRRELHRGVIVWNRSQKIQRAGTKKQRKRPQSEWLCLDAPDLRIIPEDLWGAVQARLERAGNTFLRSAGDGRLLGRPSGADLESPYLLSGLAQCAVCGGSLVAMTRGHGKTRGKFYGCVYYHKRGSTVCANTLQIRQEILDQALLQAINEVLDDRILEAAVERALERLRSGQEQTLDYRMALERELSLIEARIGHLVDAVKRGKATDSLLDTLQAEEDRKRVLVKQLSGLADLEKVASLDAKRIAQDLKMRVTDVKGLLGRHVPQARQMLRKLINGRLVCEPFEENGTRGYRFSATGTYGRLLSGTQYVNDGRIPLGPPAEFFRLSCPKISILPGRDVNTVSNPPACRCA